MLLTNKLPAYIICNKAEMAICIFKVYEFKQDLKAVGKLGYLDM